MGCGASQPAEAEHEADDDAFVRGVLPAGLWPRLASRPRLCESTTEPLKERLLVEPDGSFRLYCAMAGHSSRAWSCPGVELRGSGRVVAVKEELKCTDGGNLEQAVWTIALDGHFVGARPDLPAADLVAEEITPDMLMDLSRKERQRMLNTRERRQFAARLLDTMEPVWPRSLTNPMDWAPCDDGSPSSGPPLLRREQGPSEGAARLRLLLPQRPPPEDRAGGWRGRVAPVRTDPPRPDGATRRAARRQLQGTPFPPPVPSARAMSQSSRSRYCSQQGRRSSTRLSRLSPSQNSVRM
eukprot:COSAG04_NODE_6221_length_1381_cov_0.632605_1_plen_297_part_00